MSSTEGTDRAKKAVKAVLDDLNDRSGFDHWWGDIDSATRREIRGALAKAIEKAAHIGATRAVLSERERELLELKGPCSNTGCRLHYAHAGPCDIKPGDRRGNP
jgi:hypothetical protein